MIPTLKQLRYLVTLADMGHFGRAADACAVTQSTLSSGIQDLEATLDVRLVDRTRRQVALTPVGAEVVERARRLLSDAEDLVAVAQARRAPLSGSLRLGVIPTIAPFFLPRVLPVLRDRFADLKLFLREDQTARLIELLEANRLDVLILAFPYDHASLSVAHLFDDPFRLCRPQGTGAPAKPRLDSLNPADLLLLEDGHCLRDHILTACRVAGRGPLNTFQATSLHTLVHMVESGLGATLVPQMALESGILTGSTLEAVGFEDGDPARQIGLAWRRTSSRAAEYQLLAETLREAWERTIVTAT